MEVFKAKTGPLKGLIRIVWDMKKIIPVAVFIKQAVETCDWLIVLRGLFHSAGLQLPPFLYVSWLDGRYENANAGFISRRIKTPGQILVSEWALKVIFVISFAAKNRFFNSSLN